MYLHLLATQTTMFVYDIKYFNLSLSYTRLPYVWLIITNRSAIGIISEFNANYKRIFCSQHPNLFAFPRFFSHLNCERPLPCFASPKNKKEDASSNVFFDSRVIHILIMHNHLFLNLFNLSFKPIESRIVITVTADIIATVPCNRFPGSDATGTTKLE